LGRGGGRRGVWKPDHENWKDATGGETIQFEEVHFGGKKSGGGTSGLRHFTGVGKVHEGDRNTPERHGIGKHRKGKKQSA